MTEAAKPTQTRRILRLFYPYRVRLSGLLAMIVISAGISLISPFLLRDLLDNVLSQGSNLDTRTLTLLVGGMVAIPIVTGVIGVAQTWQSNLIGQQVMHDLRASVYTHLQRLSLAFFTRTRTGEVQSRIANDIGGVQTVVTTTATSIVSNVTTVLATTVAMAVLDWRLTLASFAILPLFVWMTRRVGRVRKALATTMQGSLADISTLVEESLSVSGVLLAKTMGQTGDLTRRFSDESRRLADLELRQRMAGRWMMATIQATFAIMPALMYGIAGYGMASGGTVVSIGTRVAFTTLQTRLLFPIGSLLNVQADLQTSTALFDRVFEYLDLPVEIEEPANPVPFDPARAAGEVEFRNVGFHYDEAGGPTLRDINFVAPAGSRVAIVGETGAGKTTLGYLTARLYDVTEGAVLIDGVDVRDLCFDALRGTIGVVSQETYLFHGTVRDNLRFAKPSATDEELEQAARAAQIHDHLASLPEGYDTVVGERGYRFSGGEKQRLAIARAVLRDPPVMVLDEATSALDVETERAVQEALEQLSRGRTTIAIAHRLSTIRDSDMILMLDEGRVIERGTHEDLVALGGRYAALVERDAVVGV
ncbi:MAG TPA: ABC transporter ATP-binding protein [Gaiellales bacterium]|nr:ABC transporter ATP-binding protein [Gaiellales bacterium]